ncbi:MAG: lipid A deacylase LpxR family protein [Acetobacteraceae bacterium]
MAAPPADPSSTLTLQLENDFLVPNSDRYYTNGVRIGYTSPTGKVPDFMNAFGEAVLGPGQRRYGIDLQQYMFTPYLTSSPNPPLTDRPYAGVLMGQLSLIQDTDDTRTILSAGLGVIGPAALAKQAQDTVHFVLGQSQSHGWSTQIPNQPVVQFSADRIWRIKGPSFGLLESDLLPSLSGGIGTFRIYGQAGAQIRFGQGLESDFGAPRMRPGLTGGDAYVQTQPFAWYFFLGVDGQLVGWDETLDGTPFGASRHVTRIPYVGELQAGAVLMAWGMRFTAAHVVRSEEFTNQRKGAFQFDTFSVSFKF